jgi:transposase
MTLLSSGTFQLFVGVDIWATSATVLLATPCLGLVTIAWLLVGTLNFTLATSPEQLTAYVGLAPMPRESGTSVWGRAQIGYGGNGRLRTALYMATLNVHASTLLSRSSANACVLPAKR